MIFRTVGSIRRGLRRGESGQAFAELTVALIAILAAFVGFLLVAALSSDRVSTLVRAREAADMKSSSGIITMDGESIRYWNYGEDEIPFTVDDSPVVGSNGDGAYFRQQLNDNSGQVALQNPPSSSNLTGAFSSLRDSDIFVSAATLTGGSSNTSTTLRDHNIESLASAINWLFHIDGTEVEETVYLPTHITVEDRDF